MNPNQLINNNFSSIEQINDLMRNNKQTANTPKLETGSKSFSEVLDSVRKSELVFSKHANERLQSRNIDLSKDQLERLQTGTKRAGEKGIKESLVMVDNLAFIVNIRNNTVITAVNDNEDKIFTNIDGAVIA